MHYKRMLTNDILRRVRYALDLGDQKVREIFALAGHEATPEELASIFKKDDEDGFILCSDALAHRFFEGLVILRRGKKDGAEGTPASAANAATARRELSNNDVLWYLRIAMQLKDDDILEILKKAGVAFGKSELNALFRKKGTDNFRPCGDQLLRNFLAGFTATFRP